ncbi:hypothetical protein [Pseudochrobactrum sp. MP213Fo]|uniref:hypothetical protein n=1 Tax=Pseudochrobactrum sp. MP213Fo TaxID=3022250 RepID=UPI003B9E0947
MESFSIMRVILKDLRKRIAGALNQCEEMADLKVEEVSFSQRIAKKEHRMINLGGGVDHCGAFFIFNNQSRYVCI